MSRRAARFSIAELVRAARAVQKATGYPVAAEIYPDGTIRIIPVEKPLPAPVPPKDDIDDRPALVF